MQITRIISVNNNPNEIIYSYVNPTKLTPDQHVYTRQCDTHTHALRSPGHTKHLRCYSVDITIFLAMIAMLLDLSMVWLRHIWIGFDWLLCCFCHTDLATLPPGK